MPRQGAILVVDDEPTIREVVGRFLTRDGFSVTEAATGEEALTRAVESWPSLVILDLIAYRLLGGTLADGPRRPLPAFLRHSADVAQFSAALADALCPNERADAHLADCFTTWVSRSSTFVAEAPGTHRPAPNASR